MLTRLSIRDFAVASSSELEFGPGMTVISGETGAGKSLLVDALGFLCGLRADSGVVRHGAARAELHAEFDLADAPGAMEWLRSEEFDDGSTCLLRRTLRADGGSRAWINGRPATLGQLAELSSRLVEIHGQHEHQALLSRASQLELLDAYGRHHPLLAAVATAAADWSALQREHDALLAAGDAAQRRDWLAHQLEELSRDALAPEALEELEAAHRRHANAAGLIEGCDAALAQLAGDDSLAGRLHAVRADLARLREHEPQLAEVDAMLESAGIQIDEALPMLQRLRDDLEADPERYLELERQLQRIHELARKHRVRPAELAERRDALEAELDALEQAHGRLETLDQEISAAAGRWQEAAAALSKARHSTGERLSSDTTRLIGELGMGGGRFQVELLPRPEPSPDPLGAERAEFLVSANAGQPPRPLRKVASGGELSRISLAIEVAALGVDPVPTMVFDEVDSGIGGAVAGTVGQKLRALAGSRQVLCVTHLPQVAAQGHTHYHVSKAEHEGATQSRVTRLDDSQRQEELARMLGGVEISREARAAARRLLSEVD